MGRFRDSLLLQFLRHPSSVGALAPSGRQLTNGMVNAVDLASCRSIVEYGPGTGVFTAEILARRVPGTPLLAIEQNEAFCDQLKKRFAGVEDFYLVHGSAEKAAEYLAERDLPLPNAILSGLPFASLPREISESILAETARILLKAEEESDLKDRDPVRTNIFITFQYSMLKMALLEKNFKLVGHARALWNFPPAHVLSLKPKKDSLEESTK
ncbi:MAG: rRNA adenine N-6-methyltransferase family protein [Planctomycetia bacterium]|nr:rRNA adenine N-6-methyltransferase family protein [Planctomycetia bacterium]